jgi:hypothetical protein
MMAGRLGVNAQPLIESLNDIGVQVREIGIEKVAAQAGIKPAIVRKFVADAMQSKNSDIRKIRAAVAALAEAEGGEKSS